MGDTLFEALQAALAPTLTLQKELGGGAMSRVFIAEDEALHRQVVVKVLAPEFEAEISAERFRAEVQSIARLQHPHIVPVLSTGLLTLPSGGRLPYYTMPLIRGESLRERLLRQGPLAVEDAVRVLRDVAEALAHAHHEGVVHRDIKPGNILLSGTTAMVTDFGVSKALGQAEKHPGLTATGMTVGTPGYMAPEQMAGDPGLDHRADIYALGVVGYEVLTGRLPFAGESYHELVASQFRDQVVPIGTVRPDLPASLARLLERCLQLSPAARYADAGEVVAALEELRTPSQPAVPAAPRAARPAWQAVFVAAAILVAVAGIARYGFQPPRAAPRDSTGAQDIGRTLVVVPPTVFGVTPEGADAELVQHLAEQIGQELSRVEGLTVKAYLSVLALLRRAPALTVREVGETLAATHVLTFVPQRSDRRLTITAHLIEVQTEQSLWVREFNATGAELDLGALRQEVVAEAVSRLFGVREPLPTLSAPATWAPSPGDPAFRQGQLAIQRRSHTGLLEAVERVEEALRADSTHVQAAAGLSNALALLLSYGYRGPAPAYEVARRSLAMAEQAVRVAPEQARGYIVRGYLTNLVLGPVPLVRADYQRAMELETTDTDFASWNAILLLRENYGVPAIAEARRAMELDPESPGRHVALALALLQDRRFEEAEAVAREALRLQPELPRAQQIRGVALLMLGRAQDCARIDLRPYDGIRAACLEASGRTGAARDLVDSLRGVVAGDQPGAPEFDDMVPAAELATYFAWRGNGAEARRFLTESFRRSPVGIDPRVLRSGIFDALLRDPSFSAELQALQDAAWPRIAGARAANGG